ncbi:alpha/beta hydrolase [Candidatus Woesearchaeota archaeon]|nr:alpha/beta hydrolase [Candidatus Woesearchaeota archaeon]MCF7901497.1 alpha/beta hydrolase [Candidatus Woesearchaeota archaeon]MCF8013919.1 alpha/beta hydrolase [Candidatus Woesearchaeota archaeon]
MKRVFIIHRWEGTPLSDWYSWVKEQLENNDFKVFIPPMPDTQMPDMDKWILTLKNLVGVVDKTTFFVGHSIGCQTILRYLETLKFDEKVGGVILVAPWLSLRKEALPDDESKRIAKPWIDKKLNFDKIKCCCDNFTTIFSTDDPFVGPDQSVIFEKELNPNLVILKNKGHFTDEEGVKKLPIVFKQLLFYDEWGSCDEEYDDNLEYGSTKYL